MKGYIISEDKMREALDYIYKLLENSDSTDFTDEERSDYFNEWRGARHAMRRLGFSIIELKEELSIS